jgi:4-hydroxy-tetrahydrodipicolinate synthase
MKKILKSNLPHGIVSILQVPFTSNNQLDIESLLRLVEDTIEAGVDGLIFPGVASEVKYLSMAEKLKTLSIIFEKANTKVPIIVGVSNDDAEECNKLALWAKDKGAVAYLVAVPSDLYSQPDLILPFFKRVSEGVKLPMIIQDFEFNGPGLALKTIEILKDNLSTFQGIKIETTPAGPKYTAVRNTFGNDFYIAGGWAVSQFIEAMDREVNAMIPESSMIRVYKDIMNLYKKGKREKAQQLFRKMLPILSFTNQDVGNSIRFFKELLVYKKIFKSPHMRWTVYEWDNYSMKITEDLIQLYLELENEVKNR